LARDETTPIVRRRRGASIALGVVVPWNADGIIPGVGNDFTVSEIIEIETPRPLIPTTLRTFEESGGVLVVV
jgi:hypothetical protein